MRSNMCLVWEDAKNDRCECLEERKNIILIVEKCALPYQYAGWIRKGGVEKKAKNIVYLIKCTGVNEVMLQMN